MEPTVLAVIMVAVLLLVLLSVFFCCLCIPKCLLHQHKVVSCLNFQISKAELLQLNRTQFPSLGIFVRKKLEIEKTKTTFIISVLKVLYYVALVFSKIKLFYL